MKITQEVKQTLSDIALECLGVETLQMRNSDDLDFYEVSVWSLEKALKLAYSVGYEKGSTETKKD